VHIRLSVEEQWTAAWQAGRLFSRNTRNSKGMEIWMGMVISVSMVGVSNEMGDIRL
jgi:hypothetical protein